MAKKTKRRKTDLDREIELREQQRTCNHVWRRTNEFSTMDNFERTCIHCGKESIF